MVRIYDNIETKFTKGLQEIISNVGVKRVDFCVGKFYVSKWLTYGDDFHLTGKDIMDFTFPFDSLSEADKAQLNIICEKVKEELPNTTQFKLNAGKYVGTFNTKKLWNLTDQSDRIFYKYMGMDVDTIQQMVESYIAACVLTDKGKADEDDI
jgi:hypothetical protein